MTQPVFESKHRYFGVPWSAIDITASDCGNVLANTDLSGSVGSAESFLKLADKIGGCVYGEAIEGCTATYTYTDLEEFRDSELLANHDEFAGPGPHVEGTDDKTGDVLSSGKAQRDV